MLLSKFVFIISGISFCSFAIASDPPYHTLHGFGTNTKGGAEGTIVKVTNLNKEGPGSLEAAIASGNCLVVFEVGGVIDLEGKILTITNPGVTIAGQTAPSPGINIIKGGIRISTNDVVIQHIAVRPGDGMGNPFDGISVAASNVVIDHCSVTWAIDENLSSNSNASNITFYRCIIAEGLSNSIHPKGEHSCGTLLMDGTINVSIIGSLYAHNFRRNPRLKDRTSVLFANNVIYNYGIYAAHIGTEQDSGYSYPYCGQGSFVGNTCLKGNDGWDDYFLEGHKGDFSKDMKPSDGIAYLNDNILLDRINGNKLVPYDSNITISSIPLAWPDSFAAVSSYSSLFAVLKSAGAQAGNRDDVDSRIISDVINGTGNIIDCQSEVGGYPYYEATTRNIYAPSDITKRQAWLDSLSALIDTDTSLNTSPLEAFITTYNHIGSEHLLPSDSNFILSPNPVKEVLKITYKVTQFDPFKIALYDTAGRVLQTIYYEAIEPGWFYEDLPTVDLTPGDYNICIETKTGKLFNRFIKQ